MPGDAGAGRARVGPLVFAGLAFITVAPAGLVTLPLVALVLLARPRGRREALVAALAGGFSLWWLLQPGTIADQTARAAAVIGTATFVLACRYSHSSLTHRTLLAAATAAVALAVLFLVGPWSWADVRYWVEHRTGFAVRVVLGPFWMAGGSSASASTAAADLEQWFATSVRLLADHYAAVVALQLMGGLSLAWALHRRVAARPLGDAALRFREFRFTEHLGWVAVVALAAVLIPRLAAAKLAAANLLVVAGALYALRGAAVATFGLAAAGGMSTGTVVVLALAAAFILPAFLAGSIVLGVLDAGLDLRRRIAARRGTAN
ncbi:MAG TPA: DUF2232 domain-containing protein [Gemmatimonadales bacterium]|nr:DUF2232 domain-containing protein [Gemmatimonadales bacterium]